MRFVALLVAALLAWAGPAVARTVFESKGPVASGKLEANGDVWFSTWDEGARFVFSGEPGRSEDLWDLVYRASEARDSVRVTYDAAAGRLNPGTGTIDYPICRVSVVGREFVSQRECKSADLSARPTSQLAIALGWAEAYGGSAAKANEYLNAALQSREVAPKYEGLAIRARARSSEALAAIEEVGSEAGDRALLSALADYRKLVGLHPDDVELQFSIGYVLEALGDYRAAEKHYDAILAKWPDENYRFTVRKAALARTAGDYQRSLDLLNTLVKGPEDLGMKFYYHRGWTLMKLGRPDEAIASFTAGMKSQPDYSSAFMQRGCAYASTNNLAKAVADLESAQHYLAIVPGAADDREAQKILSQLAAVTEIVRKKIQRRDNEVDPKLCEPLYDFEKPRSRSTLLPGS